MFDISTEDKERLHSLENQFGVKMSEAEYQYLESQLDHTVQRTDSKKMICFAKDTLSNIDDLWLRQQVRQDKRVKYHEKLISEELTQFDVVDFSTASSINDLDKDDEDLQLENQSTIQESNKIESSSQLDKRKRKFVDTIDDENDPLPSEFRHVRTSERKVKDSIYLAITDLIGIGLSVAESQKAVKIVSNRVFKRNFKILDVNCQDVLDEFDLDTLPNERSIRKVAEQVEVHGLAAEAEFIIQEGKEDNNVLTHASDSTTKKGVGKFNVAGIHINRDVLLPLPTIAVAGESKEEIA